MDRVITCPFCLDPLSAPILMCQKGHSVHGTCVRANNITTCLECRGPMSETRNFVMEQMVEKLDDLRHPCFNSDRGCKYLLNLREKPAHECECRHRIFRCEGSIFAKWNCHWTGPFADIIPHFQKSHPHAKGNFKMDLVLPLKLDADFVDLKLIPFFDGAQIFWYKHKVDVTKQKLFWTFQMVGTAKEAQHYYYEFEIMNGPVKKFKVNDLCTHDSLRSDRAFKDGKCVSLSFDAARAYADRIGNINAKFRVMAIKKGN